jgi:hypothetical protein
VKKVAPLTSVPAAFAELAKKINELCENLKPIRAGKLIQLTESKSDILVSLTLTEESLVSALADFISFPFKVSIVDQSTPTAAISGSSRLYKSISATDTQTITDLTTAFTLASDTHVWIQVTVSSLAVTAASRQTGTAWPSLVVTSGTPAAQTQFNIPVGRVVASDPTKPGFEFSISGTGYHFEQCLTSHLLVENRCNNGTPILYAFPWGGAA